ncbi:MAG: hypothetical protein ABI758_01840 [Candidatus Woesebacteria bacterium]
MAAMIKVLVQERATGYGVGVAKNTPVPLPMGCELSVEVDSLTQATDATLFYKEGKTVTLPPKERKKLRQM